MKMFREFITEATAKDWMGLMVSLTYFSAGLLLIVFSSFDYIGAVLLLIAVFIPIKLYIL